MKYTYNQQNTCETCLGQNYIYLQIVAPATSHHRASSVIHTINHHYKVYMRVFLPRFTVPECPLYPILILQTMYTALILSFTFTFQIYTQIHANHSNIPTCISSLLRQKPSVCRCFLVSKFHTEALM